MISMKHYTYMIYHCNINKTNISKEIREEVKQKLKILNFKRGNDNK